MCVFIFCWDKLRVCADEIIILLNGCILSVVLNRLSQTRCVLLIIINSYVLFYNNVVLYNSFKKYVLKFQKFKYRRVAGYKVMFQSLNKTFDRYVLLCVWVLCEIKVGSNKCFNVAQHLRTDKHNIVVKQNDNKKLGLHKN